MKRLLVPLALAVFVLDACGSARPAPKYGGTPAAPTVTVVGHVLHWTAVPGATSYEIQQGAWPPPAGEVLRRSTTTLLTFTPMPTPGLASFRVRERTPILGPPSVVVTITWDI